MRRHTVRLGLLLLTIILVLTPGCVRIPTSGPVMAGGGPTKLPEISVEVAPEPPRPGASPRAVVEGFLQAMANYQQGYGVARLYLAADVRDSWRPETGVTVYEDGYGVTATPEAAFLEAPTVGQIGPDGAFEHRRETLRHEFGMDRDADGEWRIRNPPEGLLISRYLFDTFYQPVNIYFFDPTWTTVVPDPIFLPIANRTPTALLQALLRGPTDWLSPVVLTAVPNQTRLNVQSAFIDSGGVVEVSLNEAVASLADEQRSRLGGQVAWTLSQLPGVSGVRFLMNGSPYSIPDAQQGVVRVETYAGLDPIPSTRRVVSFGATETGLVTLMEGQRGLELEPIAGAWGETPGVTALAVSHTLDYIAAVSREGTALNIGSIEQGPLRIEHGHGILRPQFVRAKDVELWTIRDAPEAGGQAAFREVNGSTEVVPLPAFAGTRVLAFRISPDATRMAVVRRAEDGRLELGLARINRTQPDVIIDGWRTLPLGEERQPGPSVVVDVGWLDATNLIVLAAEDERRPVKPYRLDEYAAEVTEIGQPDNWQATALAASPRTGGGRAMIVGRNGVWRYESDFRWPLAVRNVTAVTYAG